MATIHAPTSPLARCSVCGVHRQFHYASEVAHSADRDHAFVAATIADYEPEDLTPAQLVQEIEAGNRRETCRAELRDRMLRAIDVHWEDLVEALR